MNTSTIAGIVLSTAGILIVGMAALIKGMLLGKLNEIQKLMTEITRDVHKMDIRLTRLEAEHALSICHHDCKD